MEIHPVCNLSVVTHVASVSGGDDAIKQQWMQHYIEQGLANFEALLPDDATPFCLGEQPGIADVCLIPQLYNAERWGADISALHRVQAIAKACDKLDAFQQAHPDNVKPQ